MGNALTLPALFFLLAFSPHKKATVLAMLPGVKQELFLHTFNLTTEFLNYQAKRLHRNGGRSLYISNHSVPIVRRLRDYGFKAYGMVASHHQEISPWHVIGDIGSVPFRHESFLIVYWLDAIAKAGIWKEVLRDTLVAIEPGGYFIFESSEDSELWESLLDLWGWEKLPIRILNLSIWKKPHDRESPILKQLDAWVFKLRGGGFSPIGRQRLIESAA